MLDYGIWPTSISGRESRHNIRRRRGEDIGTPLNAVEEGHVRGHVVQRTQIGWLPPYWVALGLPLSIESHAFRDYGLGQQTPIVGT